MKKIAYYFLLLAAVVFLCNACNDEWKDELYEHYVSFKAPMNTAVGSTNIYIRYNPGGKVTYKLPLVISGSTINNSPMDVHVAVDKDTVAQINKDIYNIREDLYYNILSESQYSFPETVHIPGGVASTEMDIDFTLGEIDLVDKWVLPLTIQNDPSYNYVAHPRKNYNNAVLRVIPFNDYSGTYSSSSMNVYFKDGEETNPMTANNRTTFVVDDKTIFFYAGVQDEDLFERRAYKIKVRFNDDGTLTLTADDPLINFKVIGTPTYTISDRIDDTLPYLVHHYVVVNMEYEFDDYTSVPGVSIGYKAKGNMTMQRKINTQIPDEDQAIEW